MRKIFLALLNNKQFLGEINQKLIDFVASIREEIQRINPQIEPIYSLHIPCPIAVDSVILTSNREKQILTSWLNSNENSQSKLVYRASVDRFSEKAFYEACGTNSPTLMIITSNYNKIFGGFTDRSWDGNGYKCSSSSWLFSLDEQEMYPIKPDSTHYAIGCYEGQDGPVFGVGCDLLISFDRSGHHCYSNLGVTYDAQKYANDDEKRKSVLAGNHYFTVEEMEIFTVRF